MHRSPIIGPYACGFAGRTVRRSDRHCGELLCIAPDIRGQALDAFGPTLAARALGPRRPGGRKHAPAAADPAPPPVEPKRPATPAAAPGSWSVVAEAAKGSSETTEAHPKKKKGKQEVSSSSWQLSSGNAPGEAEAEDDVVKTPSVLVAVAQYAVLVVGLVMVLIGVFVMIANSHVT